MKVTIWIDWDNQDICSSEVELRAAFQDNEEDLSEDLSLENFLSDYVENWTWEDIWEKFNNNAEREAILREYDKAKDNYFWGWVQDTYREEEINV